MKSFNPSHEIRMFESVYKKITDTVGSLPAETGGMLGSSDSGRTIGHFHFDECADTSAGTYSPDAETLSKYVLPDWKTRGIEVAGFVHSHPPGIPRPSHGDEVYAAAILAANDLDRLALPIVQSAADGTFSIHGYYAELHRGKTRIVDAPIRIVPDRLRRSRQSGLGEMLHRSISNPPAASLCPMPVCASHSHSRVEGVYPLDVMRRKTLVCFGCGTTGEYLEAFARTGIGRMIIVDGDIYSETNLATQQCYSDEIGVNKADAVARHIARIDPEIEVVPVPRFLDDDMTDEAFEGLAGPALLERPTDVLIAGCTDDFFAQDRAMRLALKYGTPYLAGQLYERGKGAEVLFTYPGVTPACPRCILRDRYHAYLREGYENQVGSQDSPIFAAQRVNAIKGFVSLMLLLYKEKGSPFSTLLDEVSNRNILQIRMHPGPGSPVHPLFEKQIGASPCTFFDETLWIPVIPETDCPDCHGCGDLSLLADAVFDTRDIPLGGELAYEG